MKYVYIISILYRNGETAVSSVGYAKLEDAQKFLVKDRGCEPDENYPKGFHYYDPKMDIDYEIREINVIM